MLRGGGKFVEVGVAPRAIVVHGGVDGSKSVVVDAIPVERRSQADKVRRRLGACVPPSAPGFLGLTCELWLVVDAEAPEANSATPESVDAETDVVGSAIGELGCEGVLTGC